MSRLACKKLARQRHAPTVWGSHFCLLKKNARERIWQQYCDIAATTTSHAMAYCPLLFGGSKAPTRSHLMPSCPPPPPLILHKRPPYKIVIVILVESLTVIVIVVVILVVVVVVMVMVMVIVIMIVIVLLDRCKWGQRSNLQAVHVTFRTPSLNATTIRLPTIPTGRNPCGALHAWEPVAPMLSQCSHWQGLHISGLDPCFTPTALSITAETTGLERLRFHI